MRAARQFLEAFDGPPSRAREADLRNYLVALQERRAPTSINQAIAYCSPAVDGRHTVAATLANGEAAANATCTFDATEFGVGNGVCNEAFINGYCGSSEHGCGTFLACGQCADAGRGEGDLWSFPD